MDPGFLLGVSLLVLNTVNLMVELGVLDFKVGLLHQVRDLLELVVGIVGVVEHDAVEDLSEVRVKVALDSAAVVAGLLEHGLDALEGFEINAHLS